MVEPYYSDELVTLYHGDSRELLPQLVADVDLVLTDPPYANATSYASYDDTPENLRELVASVVVACLQRTRRALITCGVTNMHLYPVPTWVLAWMIPAGAGRSPWGFSCWQPVLAYGADPYLEAGLGCRPDAIVRVETSDVDGHPVPKPIDLWRWLLMRGSAVSSDLVLDPFCGAGTTLRAAKDVGRRAIGIELDAGYCEVAARQLAQQSLPVAYALDVAPAQLSVDDVPSWSELFG